MLSVPHSELEEIRDQLDIALAHHGEWFDALNRKLVCRLPADDCDRQEDAHRHCRFGQWYYRYADERLREHPGFIAVGEVHARMHRAAAMLLDAAGSEEPVPPGLYDRFTEALREMRMEMESLREEVDEAINNLDPLTGLHGRKLLLIRLRELHELVKRDVQPVTVAMMDLDRFKAVNDNHGHLCGDRVIKEAACRVLANTRPYDLGFRYGGEEFLLCLPHSGEDEAVEVMERIRGAIEAATVECEEGPVRFTASFGVTGLHPELSVEESIHRCDTALYAAKRAGRNTIRVWSPALAEG